jgi:hypothetical protein
MLRARAHRSKHLYLHRDRSGVGRANLSVRRRPAVVAGCGG